MAKTKTYSLSNIVKKTGKAKKLSVAFCDYSVPFDERYHFSEIEKEGLKDYGIIYIKSQSPAAYTGNCTTWFTPYLWPLLYADEVKNVKLYLGF